MKSPTQVAAILLILHLFHIHNMIEAYPTTLTIVNKCQYPVWAATSLGSSTTGLFLAPGESSIISIAIPPSWSGRLWGRTLCTEDSNGKFTCVTGDCASSNVECDEGNPTGPVTLAEFTLNASSGQDSFKVSFLEGYNLPIMIEPKSGNGVGECMTVGCEVDLNLFCPSEVRVMRGSDCVACKNLCQSSGSSKYCKFFTDACPLANVDAAKVSQGICASTNYLVTFCPTTTSKSSSSMEQGKGTWAWITNNIKSILITVFSILAFGVIVVVIQLTVTCSREGCTFDFGLFGRGGM